MKCIHCGNELGRYDSRCGRCGTSTTLIMKLKLISDRYYNKGLEQAKNSDLSNARDSLYMALVYNKHNIRARNLIGLVCMSVGESAEAYKHWIFSTMYKKSGNPAVEYLEYIKNNIVEFDKMDMGIKMYNEALAFLKGRPLYTEEPEKIRRRVETAVGKLKAALDFNPGLLKATNLLTLCYIILGERIKALELSKSVLYADIANPRASVYFNILCPNRSRPPVKITGDLEKKPKPTDVRSTPIEKQGFLSSTMFLEAAAFLLGIIACTAVFFFLIMPGMYEEKDARISELENSLGVYEEHTAGSETASGAAAKTVTSSETARKEADIAKAKQLSDGFYYIDACSLLYGMDVSDVSPESRNIYDSIIDDVIQNASDALADLGIKAYNEGRTEEAESFFKRALTYSQNAADAEDPLSEIKYTVIFYMGRIALDRQDTTRAVTLFSQVRDFHPDKKYQNYAESFLKSLMEE